VCVETPDTSLLRVLQNTCKKHAVLQVHDPHVRIDHTRTLQPQDFASVDVQFADAAHKQEFLRGAHTVSEECNALAAALENAQNTQ